MEELKIQTPSTLPNSVARSAKNEMSIHDRLARVFLMSDWGVRSARSIGPHGVSDSHFHSPETVQQLHDLTVGIHSRFDVLKTDPLYAHPESTQSHEFKQRKIDVNWIPTLVLEVPRIINLRQRVSSRTERRDSISWLYIFENIVSHPVPWSVVSYTPQNGSIRLQLKRTSTTENTFRYLEIVIGATIHDSDTELYNKNTYSMITESVIPGETTIQTKDDKWNIKNIPTHINSVIAGRSIEKVFVPRTKPKTQSNSIVAEAKEWVARVFGNNHAATHTSLFGRSTNDGTTLQNTSRMSEFKNSTQFVTRI